MIKFILFFLTFAAVFSFSQQKFTSDEYGFSMTFPSGWNVAKGNESMVAVIARLNNTTSINVVVQENDQWKDYKTEDVDLITFKTDLENKYEGYFKNFKAVDYGRDSLNRNNCIYFVYNCAINDDVLHAKQYFIFKRGNIYIISTGCLESEYEKYYKIVFDECVNTFNFYN